MRKIFLFGTTIAILTSCSQVDSSKKELSIPKAPASVDAVKAGIKDKSFSVDEVGTINLFNEYEWSAVSADTSKFYKDYIAERKAFALEFLNDSIARVNDDKKTFEATYNLEKDTSTAVLLNLKYMDSTFSFNPGEAMEMTSTYKIKGMENNNLLVETPRELNRRKVVVMMKSK